MNEGLEGWKLPDPNYKWKAFVNEVVLETKQLFLEACKKYPKELTSFSAAYQVISQGIQDFIVKLKTGNHPWIW